MLVKIIDINWNPEMPIFASKNFLEAVSDQYGWLGGFDEQGNLKCIIPFTIINKFFFKLARFRVETIPMETGLSLDEEKDFLNQVLYILRKMKVDTIIPATTNTIFRTYPDGAIVAPYGTFKIDLRQEEEEIWKGISESHRRKVRRAEKNRVAVKSGLEFVDPAYQLIKETFKRSRLGFMDINEFRKYIKGLGDWVKIFIAEYQNSIQACVVIPFSQYSAYYVYGGSIASPITGATNLLHWEAIRHFRKLGVRFYDFVGVRISPEKGSKQEGLYQYKERFGGKLYPGYMWKYYLNPFRSLGYQLAVKILRKGDIVDAEKRKMKGHQHQNCSN
ncbi:MAG: peptidoglycan bridge formation glycyltransferase FemA/FemB family protein [Candidatus Saccharicenans sp.]|nr:peptidoglycan bridge formation glycyltransferase FemA/FemB family protein [Candidatus Saccharicenans sp.]MDI6848905.1 peptidoglycan bridge formation glycyltransferase FemA/FemB family protein [Candidatus Saccharicenans sp.]